MADKKRRLLLRVKPKKYKEGDIVKVSLTIAHPMETGMAKDKITNKIKPAHYVEDITFSFDGEVFTKMKVWESVSANPVFSIQYKIEKAGKITASFSDNLGETNSKSKKIRPKQA
jgi:sulfur-oxidizing protein SoxZ